MYFTISSFIQYTNISTIDESDYRRGNNFYLRLFFTVPIQDRVKRNQALYVAQVAAIRKNAAAELQRRQEKLKREEEIEKLQQQEEWRQIVEAIELNSLTLLLVASGALYLFELN